MKRHRFRFLVLCGFLPVLSILLLAPAVADSLDWRFEFADGTPVKLVWQTEEDRNYDLWWSDDLSSWTHVDGFPQAGTDGSMEHPFTAGTRGFFQITSEALAPDGFVLIPAGSFLMGDQTAPNYEGQSWERPLHSVHVSAFYMARHEVTKALWDEVRTWGASHGYTDLPVGGGKAANHPVHSINWYAMVKWCNARSEMEGLTPCYMVSGRIYKTGDSNSPVCNWSTNGHRLPTEAEWEKAARGGVTGKRYPWGTDTISHAQANYRASGTSYGNLSGDAGYHPTYNDGVEPYTSAVGSFAANGYGLYDMAGNVYEWCWDWISSDYYASSPGTDPHGPASSTGGGRVFRGGNWSIRAFYCRAALRRHERPDYGASKAVGFRPVRSSVP